MSEKQTDTADLIVLLDNYLVDTEITDTSIYYIIDRYRQRVLTLGRDEERVRLRKILGL